MVRSKWTIYQGLILLAFIGVLYLAEVLSGELNLTVSSGNSTLINSGFGFFIFSGIVLSCFYLLFLFEAKKGKQLFSHPLWNKMPVIIVGVGTVSVFIFMFSSFLGPLFQWTEQWRFLIYIFFSYFLFLLFVFVFSTVRNSRMKGEGNEKAAHLAYLWTAVVILISLFFIQPF